jgi:hypothetical protein
MVSLPTRNLIAGAEKCTAVDREGSGNRSPDLSGSFNHPAPQWREDGVAMERRATGIPIARTYGVCST